MIDDGEDGGEEGDEVADVLGSSPEPPVRDEVQIQRLVVRFNQVFRPFRSKFFKINLNLINNYYISLNF